VASLRAPNRPYRSRVAVTLSLLVMTASTLVLLLPQPAGAAVSAYYVDKTLASCSNSGPGTSAAPFCSLATGVARLQAGDTVYVGDGTYAEMIRPGVSGMASSPVTITRWPGRSPTISGAGTYGANIVSRSYVVLSNLVFADTVKDGILVTGSNNITITGNEISGAGRPASGATATGITLSATSVSSVTKNTANSNNGHGIALTGASTADTVADNEASFNAEGWRRNANGIMVTAAGNAVLRNNTHDNEDSGIQFYTGGDNNLAASNLTYNNGDHGIDDLNVTGGRLIGNTVFRNCTTGINVEGSSGNYTIINNIAVDNAVYPAYAGIACSRRAGNIGIWDSAPPSTTVDHNLVSLSTPGKMYVFKNSYTSLAAMQAATGQEGGGVQADPKFVNRAAWDLRISGGSAAIDRGDSGASGAQDADILRNPRVDDPDTANTFAAGPRRYDDLGAHEFQPEPTPATVPPTARLTLSPASGTAPVQVSADASTSTDPQGQTMSYVFDFGDGSSTGSQAGATASHTFPAAGDYPVKVTVTNASGLSSATTQTVTVNAPTASPPSFVSTVANNYSTSTKSSGYITVWRAAGVRAGDLLVLTLQLDGSAATGAVSATDAAGNTYAQAASVSDGAGNRLVVLSGVATRALTVNDRITATFPTATSYRLIGDEFAGASHVDTSAGATGGGTTFSSGSTQATVGNEIAFGAVSIPVGSANPAWSTSWRDLGAYSVSGRYLGRASQLPVSGAQVASGTASGAWLAAVVTLRP
jgi:parallel beta-helix repeat protein